MRYEILSVDETGLTALELARIVSKYEIKITSAAGKEEAIDLATNKNKDYKALIWALDSVEAADFSEIKKLKASHAFKRIPLIVISNHTDKKYIIKAIEAGAVEFIARPYDADTVESKICRVLDIPACKAGAILDDIIAFNFMDMFNKEMKSASRGNYPMTIMLSSIALDADNLKNDKQKEITDILLRILKTKLRETDSLFNYDSSRLVLLLPFTDHSGAEVVKERINETFKTHSLLKDKINGCRLTTVYVSFPEDSKIKDKLLEKLENEFAVQMEFAGD